MLVQPGLCRTCSETTLLVFPRGGSFDHCSIVGTLFSHDSSCGQAVKSTDFITGVNHLSHLVGKPTMWFPNRSSTNRAVQAQKQARSLKFRSYVEEELYYPSSKNKGADQLCGYREADLRLCFRICRLLVFPRDGSFDHHNAVYSVGWSPT